MPSVVLLIITITGFTLIVPVIVWMISGSFRAAVKAWRQYLTIIGVMALPGVIVALGYLIWPPRP